MEIRTLRYFLAAAREENMTRAAELLHVTQPTLSRALRSLEDELGKKLFTRHSFNISLTEEGVLLRDRAEDLITMADKIEKEFLSLDDITGGELYLGLAESYQIRYLARELRALKSSYPGLRYHITSGDTEQVTEKLDKGLLDFAVLCDEPDGKKYEALLFPEGDLWGLILPGQDALAKKETVRVEDLVGLPLFASEQGWEGERYPTLGRGSFWAAPVGGLFPALLQRLALRAGGFGLSAHLSASGGHVPGERPGVPTALAPGRGQALSDLEQVPELHPHRRALPAAAPPEL